MDDVLNWLWQGAVVAAALSVMLAMLRRVRANVRYVVCCVAALVVAGLPILPSLQTATSAGIAGSAHTEALVALPDTWWTSGDVIIAVALLWAGVQLLRLVSAIVAIRRVRRDSGPFPAHVEALLPHWRQLRGQGRRATLVVSDVVASAAVLGWGRPMIAVAPSLVRTFDAEDLDRVLVHEWAHVQRRDDLANVLQIAVRVVAGWHPALWWIDRRVHGEREIACDETAVAVTGSPKSYADCLIRLSGMNSTRPVLRMAPAIFARTGLRARIVKIVSRDQPIARMWSRALAATTVLVLCLVAATVRGVTLVETTILAKELPAVAARTPRVLTARPMTIAALPMRDDESGRVMRHVAAPRSSPHDAAAAPAPRSPGSAVESPARDSLEPPAGHAAGGAGQATASDAPGTASANEPSTTAALPVTNSPPPVAEPRSPWVAAAAGGVAVGRTSKDAGVATAGFFSRFARHVAGSF